MIFMEPSQIISIIKEVAPDASVDLETVLIGGALDSMSLVQLCLKLEDLALEEGFSFDWTSEKAMSSMNSVFLTPATICAEYVRQQAL